MQARLSCLEPVRHLLVFAPRDHHPTVEVGEVLALRYGFITEEDVASTGHNPSSNRRTGFSGIKPFVNSFITDIECSNLSIGITVLLCRVRIFTGRRRPGAGLNRPAVRIE